MRRAFWLLPVLAGLVGWLFARGTDRAALPGAITRALEPARTRARRETTTERAEEGPRIGPKRARLPWSDHTE